MLMAVLNCLFDSLSQMLRYVLAAYNDSTKICFIFYKNFSHFFLVTKRLTYDVCLFLIICRKNVERRALLENMEGLFLAVDEIVDGG